MLSLKEAILGAQKFCTHLHPDLDALLSVWMAQRVRVHAGLEPLEVLFIPANTKDLEDGILALDMGEGKGVKSLGSGHSIKKDEKGGSASMAILPLLPDEEKDILDAVVENISNADTRGEHIHTWILRNAVLPNGKTAWEDLHTRNLSLSSTMWTVHQSLAKRLSDRGLCEVFCHVFDGMIDKGRERRQGEKSAADAQYILGGKVAILPHNAPETTSSFAYQRGAHIVIFSAEMGGNRYILGTSRNPRHREIDLSKVLTGNLKFPEQYQKDLFIHEDGFMAGWTAKAPLICQYPGEFEKVKERFIEEIVGLLAAMEGAVE